MSLSNLLSPEYSGGEDASQHFSSALSDHISPLQVLASQKPRLSPVFVQQFPPNWELTQIPSFDTSCPSFKTHEQPSSSETVQHPSTTRYSRSPPSPFQQNMYVPESIAFGHEPKAKRPWTEEEDNQLRALTQRHGVGLWATIAQSIPGRTGKQVRERWLNHLSPGVVKRPWSAEEDRIIINTHLRYGNAWSKIAKLLNGRSDNSVKNRFYTSLRRRITLQNAGTDCPPIHGAMHYPSVRPGKRNADEILDGDIHLKRHHGWRQ